MSLIKNIIRGSGNLPHIGPHPAARFAFFLTLATVVAGLAAYGWVSLIGSAFICVVCYGVPFCVSALTRVERSNRLSAESGAGVQDQHGFAQ